MRSVRYISSTAAAVMANTCTRMRCGLAIAAVLSSVGWGAGSSRAADLAVMMQSPGFGGYVGAVESSALTARGFGRDWTYFSAALDQKDRYAVGASWLPNSITFGISTNVRDGSGCLSACPSQYTSSTLGRVGFTVDNTNFYAWGGFESRRDLFILANVQRSFLAAGAGLSAPFAQNGQFFLEFEQKTQRLDCGSLCGANLLSKSEDYVVRAGVRQDFAGISEAVQKILDKLGRKERPQEPIQPLPQTRPTPFHGDH